MCLAVRLTSLSWCPIFCYSNWKDILCSWLVWLNVMCKQSQYLYLFFYFCQPIHSWCKNWELSPSPSSRPSLNTVNFSEYSQVLRKKSCYTNHLETWWCAPHANTQTLRTRTHMNMHTHVHTHMHTHAHTHMHAHTRTHMHAHTRARTHTHTCTHTRTHAHTYTSAT